MRERSVAERYARALLEVAKAQHTEERIARELATVSPVFARGTPLRRFLESLQIVQAERLQFLERTIGQACAPLALNFLSLVVKRGRVHELPLVIEEYQRLYDLDRGVQRVVATSAQPLTSSERERLSARLEALTGQTVALEEKVDENLMGGVVLRTGHHVVDGSLRRRFQELAAILRRPGAVQAV